MLTVSSWLWRSITMQSKWLRDTICLKYHRTFMLKGSSWLGRRVTNNMTWLLYAEIFYSIGSRFSTSSEKNQDQSFLLLLLPLVSRGWRGKKEQKSVKKSVYSFCRLCWHFKKTFIFWVVQKFFFQRHKKLIQLKSQEELKWSFWLFLDRVS